ncbi:hypothetical protein PRIPAC_97478 [Pristionchus pacificus]|uniref:Uncharacterized protein n=1 Tax=Pristionchus pacificus TaxID=54126 RepID=A0A2A6B3D0_PRIPA|nr:hypothetical protein PRIPAC_97478 [Pristionchus pacificus]|eukprot:PDM60386.1 hypothetical protein PRIPAC_54211 [Pristionchus pacificus]
MNQISWKDENAQALSSCYVSRKSSIRREVLDIVVQPSFGCWWGCDADPKCEATLLQGDANRCVYLGAEIADPLLNVCTAPFTTDVKCTAITP